MASPIRRQGSTPWMESTPPFTRIAYQTILYTLIPPDMRRFESNELHLLLADEDAFGIVHMKLQGFAMRPGLEVFISSCFEITLHLTVLQLRRQEGFRVFLETSSFVQLRLQFADPPPVPIATPTTT